LHIPGRLTILFVAAGILKASHLAGYKSHQVYIGNWQHVPLRVGAMRDEVPALFEKLQEESEVSGRAVLGHLFSYLNKWQAIFRKLK
jgi:hypothetical protein